ncbi:DNA-binding domain-containing protein, AraC-type [Idiomarina sp. A28L]|nr:DNA-binding domain-containing protein, AraC-type [Idiomarina sp. A28L]
MKQKKLDNDEATLNSLLGQLAFHSHLIFESGLCGSWRLVHEETTGPSVHIVTAGSCWLAFPDNLDDQLVLNAGDVVLFTATRRHWFAAEPIKNEHVGKAIGGEYCEPNHVSGGLVCYDIQVQSILTKTIFSSLPEVVHIPQEAQSGDLNQLIQLIMSESQNQRVGSDVAVSRLSDVLVLYFLRQALQDNVSSSGLLAAICDEKLRTIVIDVMNKPEYPWTVEDLAKLSFLSKSAFADRCRQITGLAPKHLVGELRLQKARELLLQTVLPLEVIAEKIGYQSATAFIRFFKQFSGMSPGDFREHHEIRHFS